MNFPPVSRWSPTHYGFEANAIGLIANLKVSRNALPKHLEPARYLNGHTVLNMDGYSYAVRKGRHNLK